MKIKKGDLLIIKDTGEVYSTYTSMFIKLGFKNPEINNKINEGEMVVVFGIDNHEDEWSGKVYAVNTYDGRQGLFSKEAFFKK